MDTSIIFGIVDGPFSILFNIFYFILLSKLCGACVCPEILWESMWCMGASNRSLYEREGGKNIHCGLLNADA